MFHIQTELTHAKKFKALPRLALNSHPSVSASQLLGLQVGVQYTPANKVYLYYYILKDP